MMSKKVSFETVLVAKLYPKLQKEEKSKFTVGIIRFDQKEVSRDVEIFQLIKCCDPINLNISCSKALSSSRAHCHEKSVFFAFFFW